MRRFQAETGFDPSPLRLVYTRCFSSRTTSKSGDHGVLVCRPRKMSYGSGTTPSRAEAAPSGPAQKRDNKTHRPVKLPSGGLLDRGPPSSYVTKAGQVRSLRGSGWPPTKGIAWIRTRKRRAFPRKPGGRSGGRILSCVKRCREFSGRVTMGFWVGWKVFWVSYGDCRWQNLQSQRGY